MAWLNYHHLSYFHAVAHHGSVSAACEALHVSQPTISAQLKTLEQALGRPLFKRVGRRLALTDTGRTVYRYAERIFALGDELLDVISGGPGASGQPLTVGVSDAVPKLIAFELLRGVVEPQHAPPLICREGHLTDLLAQLARHELDLVISDAPLTPTVTVAAFGRLLGECGVCVLGSTTLTDRYRAGFPQSLQEAPLLLPTRASMLRREIDGWLEREGLRVQVVGEFDDSALLKTFGQAGHGLIFAPAAIEAAIRAQYQLHRVGTATGIETKFYGLTLERRSKHPAIQALYDRASSTVFAPQEDQPSSR